MSSVMDTCGCGTMLVKGHNKRARPTVSQIAIASSTKPNGTKPRHNQTEHSTGRCTHQAINLHPQSNDTNMLAYIFSVRTSLRAATATQIILSQDVSFLPLLLDTHSHIIALVTLSTTCCRLMAVSGPPASQCMNCLLRAMHGVCCQMHAAFNMNHKTTITKYKVAIQQQELLFCDISPPPPTFTPCVRGCAGPVANLFLISSAIVINACSTLLLSFAEVSKKGMPSSFAKS
jgi:hypothetical protein